MILETAEMFWRNEAPQGDEERDVHGEVTGEKLGIG